MSQEAGGIPFVPVNEPKKGRKLSSLEYEGRRNQATFAELRKLQSSPAFQKWSQQQRGRRLRKSAFVLPMLVACLIFPMYHWWHPHSQQAQASLPDTVLEELASEHEAVLASQQEAGEQLLQDLHNRETIIAASNAEITILEASMQQADSEIQALRLSQREAEAERALLYIEKTRRQDAGQISISRMPPLTLAFGGVSLALLLVMTSIRISLARRQTVSGKQAQREALEKLKAANELKAAAEQEIKQVQESIASMDIELKAAQVGKHQVEQQLQDLQKRYMACQAGGSTSSFSRQEALYEQNEILEELAALRTTVSERDTEVLSLNEELCNLTERLPREIQDREAAVSQIRQWLHQAQGQLQNTQEALNSREKECRSLKDRLADSQYKEATLTDALEAARGREEELQKEYQMVAGDAKAKVSSIMELMKTQRITMSQKLAESYRHSTELMSELSAAKRALQWDSSPVPTPTGMSFKGFNTPPSTRRRHTHHGNNENAQPGPPVPPIKREASPPNGAPLPLRLSPTNSGVP